MVPEEAEDMWHAYNIIAIGDQIKASTIRKVSGNYIEILSKIISNDEIFIFVFFAVFVQVQNETATGSSSSSRVRTTLTIRVENIDYDTQACMLRLKGRNVVENDYVKVSHHHTVKTDRKILS